ncbi:MAG: hypothetical protein ACRCVT_10085 [Leadbetterella sp.]
MEIKKEEQSRIDLIDMNLKGCYGRIDGAYSEITEYNHRLLLAELRNLRDHLDTKIDLIKARIKRRYKGDNHLSLKDLKRIDIEKNKANFFDHIISPMLQGSNKEKGVFMTVSEISQYINEHTASKSTTQQIGRVLAQSPWNRDAMGAGSKKRYGYWVKIIEK